MICYFSKKDRCFNTTARHNLSLFPVKFNVLLRLEIAVCSLWICHRWFEVSCKGIRIPESGKYLLAESGIWEIFASGIQNPGVWNPEYSSRSPESHLRLESGIQIPLTWIRNPVPEIVNPCRGSPREEGVCTQASTWNPESKSAFHLSELASRTIARQRGWQRNRLFPEGLDEKPSPPCIKFKIWLILLEIFDLK